MKRIVFALATAGVVAAVLTVRAAQSPAKLIVHEWGTITTQHAPDGTPRGRLNRISASEVLPSFVHRYEPLRERRQDGDACVE